MLSLLCWLIPLQPLWLYSVDEVAQRWPRGGASAAEQWVLLADEGRRNGGLRECGLSWSPGDHGHVYCSCLFPEVARGSSSPLP